MTRNQLTEALLGKEVTIRFVSLAEAIALHDASIARIGGTPGVRDVNLLESALHKPMQRCLYDDEEDVVALAAVLADGVTQNHAFLDGNKRTAFLACVCFLSKNGIEFSPDVAEAIDLFRRLANHEADEHQMANWIRSSVATLSPVDVVGTDEHSGHQHPAPGYG